MTVTAAVVTNGAGAAANNTDGKAETQMTPADDADQSIIDEIKEHARQIEKSVNQKEPRNVLRVLRTLVATIDETCSGNSSNPIFKLNRADDNDIFTMDDVFRR